jgi:signal transduction histidine kinase
MTNTPGNMQERMSRRTASLEGIQQRGLEFARVGFYRYKFDGTVLSMDRNTLKLLDLSGTYTPDQVVGMQIGDMLVYTGKPGRLRERLRKSREVRGFEYPYRTLSGKDRCAVHNSFVIEDAELGEEVVQVICMDITELHETRQKLEKLNAELEHRVQQRTAELEAANSELRTFASSVSHDLKAPLRTVDGFSEVLLEDFGKSLGEEAKEHLLRIRNACGKMGALIEGLLGLSRVTQRELEYGDVNLSELAAARIRRLRDLDPARKVETTIAKDIRAEADIILVGLVIDNLLDNAWKFTRTVSAARIEFGQQIDKNGERVFYVGDNGVGFDPAYADRLFTTFQRLHDPGEYDGEGIGLTTAKRIVNRHGGRIWAESQPNEGATFFFTLGPEPCG